MSITPGSSRQRPSRRTVRSYPNLAAIPGGVEAVVIGTRPERALGTVRECESLGITQVWMHRSVGVGSVSREATDYGP